MKYYKITLNSVPKFLFCCAVTVNNYKNSFHKKPNFLEIAVNLDGCVVIKNKDYSCMIKSPPRLQCTQVCPITICTRTKISRNRT